MGHKGAIGCTHGTTVLVNKFVVVPSVLTTVVSAATPITVLFVTLMLKNFRFFVAGLRAVPDSLRDNGSMNSLTNLKNTSTILNAVLTVLFTDCVAG